MAQEDDLAASVLVPVELADAGLLDRLGQQALRPADGLPLARLAEAAVGHAGKDLILDRQPLRFVETDPWSRIRSATRSHTAEKARPCSWVTTPHGQPRAITRQSEVTVHGQVLPPQAGQPKVSAVHTPGAGLP
ncbi:hypothetical protein ACN6AT_35230 [Streptomyces sp. JL4002]|uniref:hypothetical protein n=1 Tax=Streptomyces sp. JL4002 TaxID=3404781 RepID=UPI003B27B8EA